MVEPLSYNEQGEVTSYRVYKQWTSLTPEEKEAGTSGPVQEFIMCNPCGNYIRQRGIHRPPQFWDKNSQKQPGEKKKRVRSSKAQSAQTLHPQSDFFADTMHQFTSDCFQDISTMLYTDPLPGSQFDFSNLPQIESTPAPPIKQSANAADGQEHVVDFPDLDLNGNWDPTAVDAALHRAIQSSPARALGASQQSPIEIDPDLTSKPTSRLLFPSPRKEGQFKSLGDGLQDTVTASPIEPAITEQAATEQQTDVPVDIDLSKAAQTIARPGSAGSNESTDVADKENQPPPIDEQDDLAHLFEDLQEKTPTHGSRSPGADFIAGLLKTPTPSSKRTRRSTTRSGSRRSHLSPIKDLLLNTPSRLTRSASKALKAQQTPTRANNTNGSAAENLDVPTLDTNMLMTPMTAHLHKLLTDGLTSPLHHHETSDVNIDFSDYLNATDYGFTDLPMPSSPPGLGAGGANDGSEFDFNAMPEFGIWEDGTAEPAVEEKNGEGGGKDGEAENHMEGVVECKSN
jgi:hypothetical protein